MYRRRTELINRIDERGILTLTLSDINPMVDFEEAGLSDVIAMGGYGAAIYSANKIVLVNDEFTKIKVLKDRSRPVPYYESLVWKPIDNYEKLKL